MPDFMQEEPYRRAVCALAIRPPYIQNADLKKITFQNLPDQSTNEDQSFKNSA